MMPETVQGNQTSLSEWKQSETTVAQWAGPSFHYEVHVYGLGADVVIKGTKEAVEKLVEQISELMK